VSVLKNKIYLLKIILDGTIQASLSNFGRIPYGYNLIGKVFFNPVNLTDDYACRQLPYIGDTHSVDESPIIMVHRGSCSFVTKVRNVENAGGHVALIIDNVEEEISRVVMADDGRGRELSIPGVLINAQDGKILTDFFSQKKDKSQDLVLEVDFEMEHPSNTVKYDFYSTADNESVYKLMIDFFLYQMELWEKTNLTVHYVTYQHPQYDTQNSLNNRPRDNCLGNGKYCATPGKFGVTDGREIIYEAIKQKCIYNYAYEEVGQNLIYWLYIREFYMVCLNTTTPQFTRECSATATKKLGVPNDVINKCIHDSYIASTPQERLRPDFEMIAENRLLDKDNEDRQTYLLSFIPSITINGRTFWGSWRADNVFEAICAGFHKKPEVCYSEGAFKKKSKLSWFSVFFIIIAIISVNAVIFYFCKNYIRRKIVERIESTDINHKINTVVTSYLALRENK
jgi:hypothetical protein